MSPKSRGAALITVLLLFALLLVLGLSLLTRARLNKSLGARLADLSSARNLALTGLEDFRQKMARDLKFPPAFEDGEVPSGYSEALFAEDGRLLGQYQVEYSLLRRESHGVIIVTSRGLVNSSRTTLTAYLQDADGLPWLAVTGETPDLYP